MHVSVPGASDFQGLLKSNTPTHRIPVEVRGKRPTGAPSAHAGSGVRADPAVAPEDAITTTAVTILDAGAARAVDRDVLALRLSRLALGVVLVCVGLLLVVGAVAHAPVRGETVLFLGWWAAFVAATGAWVLVHLHASWAWVGRVQERYLAVSIAAPVAGAALVLPATVHVLLAGAGGPFVWVVATMAALLLVLFASQRVLRRERLVLAAGMHLRCG